MERMYSNIEDPAARAEAIHMTGIEIIEDVKKFFGAMKKQVKTDYQSMDDQTRVFNAMMYRLGIKKKVAGWIWKNKEHLSMVEPGWFDDKLSEDYGRYDLHEFFISAVKDGKTYDELVEFIGITPIEQKPKFEKPPVNLDNMVDYNRIINPKTIDRVRNVLGFETMLAIKPIISNFDLRKLANNGSLVLKEALLKVREDLNTIFGGYQPDVKFEFDNILLTSFGINKRTSMWLYDHMNEIGDVKPAAVEGEKPKPVFATVGWFLDDKEFTADERFSLMLQLIEKDGNLDAYVKFVNDFYDIGTIGFPEKYVISPEAIAAIDNYYAKIGKQSVTTLLYTEVTAKDFLGEINEDVRSTIGKWFKYVWSHIHNRSNFLDMIGMDVQSGYWLIDETKKPTPELMYVWFKEEAVLSNYPLFAQIAKLATVTGDLSLFDAYVVGSVINDEDIESLSNVLLGGNAVDEQVPVMEETEADAFCDAITTVMDKQDPDALYLPRNVAKNAVELGDNRHVLTQLGTMIHAIGKTVRPGKAGIKEIADELIRHYGIKPKVANGLAKTVGLNGEPLDKIEPDMFRDLSKEAGVSAADLYNLMVTLIGEYSSNGISIYRSLFNEIVPTSVQLGLGE